MTQLSKILPHRLNSISIWSVLISGGAVLISGGAVLISGGAVLISGGAVNYKMAYNFGLRVLWPPKPQTSVKATPKEHFFGKIVFSDTDPLTFFCNSLWQHCSSIIFQKRMSRTNGISWLYFLEIVHKCLFMYKFVYTCFWLIYSVRKNYHEPGYTGRSWHQQRPTHCWRDQRGKHFALIWTLADIC